MIINMIADYIGQDIFDEKIKQYLALNAFGNVVPVTLLKQHLKALNSIVKGKLSLPKKTGLKNNWNIYLYAKESSYSMAYLPT